MQGGAIVCGSPVFLLPCEVFDVRHRQGMGLAHPDISLGSGHLRRRPGHHRPDWRQRHGLAFSVWLRGTLPAFVSVNLGRGGWKVVAFFFLSILSFHHLAPPSGTVTARTVSGSHPSGIAVRFGNARLFARSSRHRTRQ